MFEKLNCFYDDIVKIADKMRILPSRTHSLIYDPRYTPDWLIENLRSGNTEELWEDGGHCYVYLMEEIAFATTITHNISHVCDSDEIGEEYLDGDYSYYTGFIRDDVPFMFHQASHEWIYPNRLVLYGPEFQIELITDRIDIEVFDVVPKVRDLFYIPKGVKRIESIKEFLRNSDRPLLDVNFDRKK